MVKLQRNNGWEKLWGGRVVSTTSSEGERGMMTMGVSVSTTCAVSRDAEAGVKGTGTTARLSVRLPG